MLDFNTLLGDAGTAIAEWTPRVLGALAVVVGGWIFARWARSFSRTALERAKVDPILVPFVAGIVHVALVVLVTIAAVTTLGVSTTSFVTVLGAAGLAIALAFQSTFSNFAAGVMLLTFRPFEVGNSVEVGGSSGSVREVGIFTCLLTTGDNIQIRIPNAQIFGHTIKNYSASATRRIDMTVGVSYDDDLGVAVRACLDVLAADRRVLDEPESLVAVHELGDWSVNLVVRPWVAAGDYWATRWDLTRALKETLEAAGCSLPYPQRDIHLHQVA